MSLAVALGLDLASAAPPTNNPATNPTVAVPPRINRTNTPDSTAAGAPPTAVTQPIQGQPPLTTVRPSAPPANPSGAPGTNANPPFRGPPPVARAFTNLPNLRTNLVVPSAPAAPGTPPAVAGAVQRAGTGAAAPGGTGAGAGPTVATPPSTLTAVEVSPPGSPAEEVFPPGLIKFQDADISQVLEVYQELTGRTVMRPNNLPQTKVTIRSQTPLTRKEAIQALDSILSLNGVAMSPQGEKFVKAVPSTQAGT